MKLIKALHITALTLFILGLTFGSACATDNDIKSLSVKKCSIFSITLRSNPTTGYSWKIAKISSPLIVKNLSSEYLPDNTGLTGSGGREIWKFKALKCGNASIEFVYQRPWEKNVAPAEKKKYLVKVRP